MISKEILEEFSGVLGYREIQDKVRSMNLAMRRTVEKIASLSTIVDPYHVLNEIPEDPDNNRILECALEGKAMFIISKDRHLLKLREFKGIKIVTPSEFLGNL